MQAIKLGQLCQVRGRIGFRGYKKSDLVKAGEGAIVIGGKNISTNALNLSNPDYISWEKYYESPEIMVSTGDIVIAQRGTIGKMGFVKNEIGQATINPSLVLLKDITCDNAFLFYYLLTLQDYIISQATQTVIPMITQKQIENLTIQLPDIDTQKAIVNTLQTIDDKISTNNKTIETSEKLMREIYDYWFVQFDFPDGNGRPYKSSGGEMVYNEKLKREIPKGWKVQNLLKNDLCKDIKPGIDKFNDAKTYYATADVIGGEMGVGAQIDYNNRESRANMQPKSNSVWFAKMKNSIKHITVIPTSDDLLENSIFSTGFFGLKCDSETLPYIRSFIYSDYFEKVKDLNSNGATMEAISNDGVRNVKLIIPDDVTLKKYSDVTSVCLSQNDTLRKENAKLISLRDWLLPMLMNGQAKIVGDL